MYLKHWNLKIAPFDNSPNPNFLYHSNEHDEALMRLLYSIQGVKGASLLSGEYGCGKTLLMHTIIEKLGSKKFNIAYLTNPRWSAEELIQEILYQLEIPVQSNNRIDMLHALNTFLYNSVKENKHTLIIIDEAQTIDDTDTFEELRMLLNFQLNDRFLLTLFLVGQPELKDIIQKIPQLDQRIAIRYHLERFDLDDTKKYINFRLQTAGNSEEIFKEDAIQIIYDYSSGTPRKINNICDLSLVIGYGQQINTIDGKLIKSIIESEG